jgi:hypothetical protein
MATTTKLDAANLNAAEDVTTWCGEVGANNVVARGPPMRHKSLEVDVLQALAGIHRSQRTRWEQPPFGSEERRREHRRDDSPKRSTAPPLPQIQLPATKILESLPILATMTSKKKELRKLDADLRSAPRNELY